MAELEFREPCLWHMGELVDNMRPADAAEVRASTGEDALDGIVYYAIKDSSESWVALFDGHVAAIWGVVPGPADGIGFAWLLTTTMVDRHPKLFWRICKLELAALLGRWKELQNYIDTRHTQALRWARRLGFVLDPPAPLPHPGSNPRVDFQRFTVRAEDLNV